MTEAPHVVVELRSQRDVVESMLFSTAWDKRSRQQKMYIMGRAKKLGLDIYRLRAIGWQCSEQTARAKLHEWLTAPEPTKEMEC